MHRAPRLLLAFLLGTGVATVQPSTRLMASSAKGAEPVQSATLKAASAAEADIPFPNAELSAEQELLMLANQSRQRTGAPALRLDRGLSQAARLHAQAMADARELSHQFSGEPSLPQRLATSTGLQLDQEGENVAFDYDAGHGHEHLMLSAPHRANLLNPAYNVVGLGVVRSGDRLYIVQDFGHALPNYSAEEVKNHISTTVNRTRHDAHQADLHRQEMPAADEAACSMADADKLGTLPVRKLAERFTVLSYNSLRPEMLPNGAARAINSHSIHNFSVGACYGRTNTYPTGAYWVVLTLE